MRTTLKKAIIEKKNNLISRFCTFYLVINGETLRPRHLVVVCARKEKGTIFFFRMNEQ